MSSPKEFFQDTVDAAATVVSSSTDVPIAPPLNL